MGEQTPSTAGDVLVWCKKNGVIPIPCRPHSKAPAGVVSSRGVYGNSPPDRAMLLRHYGRAAFGTSVRDSFHVPSPERLAVIEAFWASPSVLSKGAREISISIDMNYPTADGHTVACLDIDSDDYRVVGEHSVFASCPAIRGKKGEKIFFKLDRGTATPPAILRFTTSENRMLPGGDRAPPVIELFTGRKHALIFGEHPDSTPEHPLFYSFTRGFGEMLPVLRWRSLYDALLSAGRTYGLVILPEDETALSPDQILLSVWDDSLSPPDTSGSAPPEYGQLRLSRWDIS